MLETEGISVETVDLSEILYHANRLNDGDKPVKEKIAALKDYADAADVPDMALGRMARLAVALEEWINDNRVDAIALQCWTSIEENYGVVPCSVMSMLSEAMIPAACEVDVSGAIAMYAMALASGQPSALLDWNNNYGDDPDKCVFFHCSNLPASFFGRKPKMCYQAIIAGSVGEENAYGTCEGPVAPGPFTFLRVDTDEDLGVVRAYTGAGKFTKDELETFGGYGVAEIAGLQSLMHYICRGGFAHHVALNRSRVDDIVHEALAQYLNWDLYHHIGD
jgi:L-fucose isomerase-like protein